MATTVLQEKRKGQEPIPDNILELLTDMQLLALKRIENFGWTLKFVRRPLFQAPVVVVENATGMSIGVLDEDGEVDLQADLNVRS
jgi:hypothetical protein